VTAVRDYEDFNRLLDQLPPERVQELRHHALRLVEEQGQKTATQMRSTPRDLSIIGLIHAEPDLAERAKEIVREGLGH
jgi:hypothetical protein